MNRRQRPYKYTINVSGGFYIGDLCYALSREAYHKQCICSSVRVHVYNGLHYVSVPTAYGDGEFIGSSGKKYNVDSGTIGICGWDLVDKNRECYLSSGRSIPLEKAINDDGRIVKDYSGPVTIEVDYRDPYKYGTSVEKAGKIIITWGDNQEIIETRW